MITFTIALKEGTHLRAESLDLEEVGPEDLAKATDIARQANRRAIKARDA